MTPYRVHWVVFLCVVLPVAAAAQVPADVQLTPFASSGLLSPIALRAPHDGSGRLFVLERDGAVKILGSGGNLIGTYLNVPVSTGGEQGLLGMAFDPNFGIDAGQPGYGAFYLAFTAPASDPQLGTLPDQVVRRYTVANPASNSASGAVAVDVIRIPDLYNNHNGGDIHFGPDGYLYYGMGDGGSGGDPNGFAQATGRKSVGGLSYYLLGKMLRLDVRHPAAAASADMCAATPGQAPQYAIPPGNPFAGSSTNCGEIWLYGLRNPFRWSFDRSTGDLWIGDVGQDAWEEVDLRANGDTGNRNYGWNLCEGNHHYNAPGSGTSCPATTGTVAPVLEYDHSGGRCAITGGFRYRGPTASLQGTYIYADSCSSTIWFATLTGATWNPSMFPSSIGPGYGTVVSFGEDAGGNLYLVSMAEGRIYEFTSTAGNDEIFKDGFDGP